MVVPNINIIIIGTGQDLAGPIQSLPTGTRETMTVGSQAPTMTGQCSIFVPVIFDSEELTVCFYLELDMQILIDLSSYLCLIKCDVRKSERVI